MIITLHVQRSQGKGTAFETSKVAFHQVFVAIGFYGLFQCEVVGQMVGGRHTPSQLTHGILNGLFFPLAADGKRDMVTRGKPASTVGSHWAFLHVFLDLDTQHALAAKAGENVLDALFNCFPLSQSSLALSSFPHFCHLSS